MKISNAKTSLCLGLACCMLAAPMADAQGLFNRKKKDAEPATGSSLFPSVGSAEYTPSSSPSAPQDSAIFKSGQPNELRETSYTIQDGVKVQKKRLGLFQKLRKPANQVPTSATVETPDFDIPPAPAPVVTSPTITTPVVTTPTVPAEPTTTLPEVTKERRFGFPSLKNLPKPSIPRIRRDEGPIDTTGAEVLVNNNGSLTSTTGESNNEIRYRTNRANTSTNRTPPRQEGDALVYNSWDNVPGRSTSAADKIVKDMKAQEAAHKRKVEAAKRKYEEERKKAEADARIRAIMQGAMQPPPGVRPPGF